MHKDLRYAVWYMISLSAAIFTMTIFLTIQGAPLWAWSIGLTLALLQLAGLSYHLHHDPRKAEPGWLKWGMRLVLLSGVGCFVCLAAGIFALASQYHNPIPVQAEPGENTVIEQTDLLYILYPEYTSVELVTRDRPSRSDPAVTFCSGAAFQKTYDLSFSHDGVVGMHVEDGILYTGSEKKGLGAFAFFDGQFAFAAPDEAQDLLRRAADAGGFGFQQFMVIDEGQIIREPTNEYRCFRFLAELDGKLCIIDSRKQIGFHDFAEAVRELGVRHALYMDMGSGWNYSWYRDSRGRTANLIGLPWPFSHNWIAFRK